MLTDAVRVAPGQRRAARRVPLGRRRLEPRRRPDGARSSGARVKTFSIGFDEPAFDELEHARGASRSTSAPTITSSSSSRTRVGILDQLVAHFDEPFADSSAIPTWYVSEIARRHVTVVLSGDGGDELFGGYDRYLPHPRVVGFDRYSPRGAAPRRGDRRRPRCRTAPAARTSCATSRATTRGAISTRSGSSAPTRSRRC